MQKKKSKISLKKTKDIALSIQFSLDGFSFCVVDSITKETIFFTEYLFRETLNSPEDLLTKIEVIFKENTNLQLDYNWVTVIHHNHLATLVPSAYFDENSLATYLNFNIKTLNTDFIAFDEIIAIDAKNVYVPYININNYLFQNFGGFEYKHHISVLIDKLLKIDSLTERIMYVNVYKSSFDIVIIEDQKIILSNSFLYHSKVDFIYYILFTAEQLQLNTEEFKLYFMGEIDTDADIYKITYNYIKNIFFLESQNAIFEDLEAPNHSNFILLH